MVTDQQVRKYRERLKLGWKRETAALAAGMTAKTARRWEEGPLPSMSTEPRTWRTREDPLAEVWDRHVVPLLESDENGELQATTILDALRYTPGATLADRHLRTLQRRIRDWRALKGPGKEVFFEQAHPPGREAQVDFTHAEELMVTIGREPFPHLFFEMLLSHSKWRFVGLAFGETFEALLKGTQDAIRELGGLFAVLRSDNLSAATFNLKGDRKPTKRFQAVLDHFGLDYTRIQAGKSNENGVVEKGHDVFKTAMKQALILRGSRDFPTMESYLAFVQEVRDRLNLKVAERFAEERRLLRPLPTCWLPTYTDVKVCVRKWSTMRVQGNTYSVPSNLIGREVTARVHPDMIEVLYRDKVAECFPRLRGSNQQRIDYRHVIHSLVRKPGAFARYRYREELFPTLLFRRAYDALRQKRGERAEVEYVRILHLAATTMESEVETALGLLLEAGRPFDFADVECLVDVAPRPVVTQIAPQVPDLRAFDSLFTGEFHARLESEGRIALAS